MDQCLKGRWTWPLRNPSTGCQNTVDSSPSEEAQGKNVAVYFEKRKTSTPWMTQPEMILTILEQPGSRVSHAISTNVKWGYARKFERNPQDRKLWIQEGANRRCASWRRKPLLSETWPVVPGRGRSLERIQHGLEDAGIETTTGEKTWSTGTIYNILTNQKIMGDVLLQKTFTAGLT